MQRLIQHHKVVYSIRLKSAPFFKVRKSKVLRMDLHRLVKFDRCNTNGPGKVCLRCSNGTTLKAVTSNSLIRSEADCTRENECPLLQTWSEAHKHGGHGP